ncbi:conserved protein of unknown function [Pseudomonas marincola]|jgi:glutamine synthetase|uniref:Glutamine synthetase n=1 Tax=Pseudomonas marincola TaxID=437900 RepID=A0A653E4Y4_9PSED|nr:MAG: hypothetical protein B7X51_07025 [Pseudomonas sp. 34-62-33]CAE6883137.1 conserved protein of unknown function [Pseudomonas marincola]
MLPSETQKIIDQHGIKYVLAQFVDIHGAAKTKSVPVSGLKAVAEEGAGSCFLCKNKKFSRGIFSGANRPSPCSHPEGFR